MPIYEYICEECQARFELLRPSREASAAQPCPNCDTDSKRVMSQQWSAFVHRDGRQRQLPDDGGYWHLGKKVTKPITRSAYGIEHPEINRKAPDTPGYWELFAQFYYHDVNTPEYCRYYSRGKHAFKSPGKVCLDVNGEWEVR